MTWSIIARDPATGDFGIAVAAKLYWRRLTGFFKRQPQETPAAEPQTADRD